MSKGGGEALLPGGGGNPYFQFRETPTLTYMYRGACAEATSLRVHVPNNWVLGIWIIVTIVQVWDKYMIIGYLEP